MRTFAGSILLGGLLAAAALTAGSPPAQAALREGDAAPDFQAPASRDGKTFSYSLRAARQKGPVVVYFYPSAFTKGCNLEAHTFSENAEHFAAAGASIIGVSLDGIDRLNAFSADPEYCAGKIPVASDGDGSIARAYQVTVKEAAPGRQDSRGVAIDHGFADRVTYVVAADGRVAAALGGLSPVEHVEKALDIVRHLSQ